MSDEAKYAGLRVLAGIPCHDEAPFIGDVVARARRHVDEVIVVDDGSSDGTPRIAEEAGAWVVSHPTNLGYGQAVMTCFAAALERGADVLVTLDGDGQHDPDDLPAVLEPVISGRADLSIGSRFLGRPNNVPRYRRFGIDVITFLYNVGAPHAISDAQSGMRAFRRPLLERLELSDRGMGLSVEVLVQARRLGFRMAEVPISCRYHAAGSSIHPVRHGVGVALKVVQFRLLRELLELPPRGRSR